VRPRAHDTHLATPAPLLLSPKVQMCPNALPSPNACEKGLTQRPFPTMLREEQCSTQPVLMYSIAESTGGCAEKGSSSVIRFPPEGAAPIRHTLCARQLPSCHCAQGRSTARWVARRACKQEAMEPEKGAHNVCAKNPLPGASFSRSSSETMRRRGGWRMHCRCISRH
jgi:hypothetical protein